MRADKWQEIKTMRTRDRLLWLLLIVLVWIAAVVVHGCGLRAKATVAPAVGTDTTTPTITGDHNRQQATAGDDNATSSTAQDGSGNTQINVVGGGAVGAVLAAVAGYALLRREWRVQDAMIDGVEAAGADAKRQVLHASQQLGVAKVLNARVQKRTDK